MNIAIRVTIFLFFICHAVSAVTVKSINFTNDNEPTIIIHDTVVAPGELLLQIDALNFVGDDGQVAAITLNIDIDTLLVEFISIQNTGLPGSWLGNYNTFQNEITITYTAPFGSGYDIDGKLLDLKLVYNGGFDTDLLLKPNCEISNVNLVPIFGIIYDDGYIGQIEPVGAVYQDSVLGFLNQPFLMPIIAEGVDYDSVNEIYLRLGYDTAILNYNTTIESALQGIIIFDSAGILTCKWESSIPVSFATEDTMLLIQFDFIGDTNTITQLLPGSAVYNNGVIVASSFDDGYVETMLPVTLLNQPDTAGTTLGSGYYFIGDTVTAIAIPEAGFHFSHWTQNNTTVSTDSIYTFVKQASTDTLIANYIVNSYDVNIIITPILCGFVSGQGSYLYGDIVTVTATPVAGYEFIGWFLDSQMVSSEPIYTFIMPYTSMELTAAFQPLVYDVFVLPNNTTFGSTSGGGQYNYGDTTTIVAIPASDYCFVAWTENGQFVSSDSSYSLTVYRDYNFVGNFEQCSNCMPPVGLFADNLNETEATLNWTPSGDEAEWDIIWGEHGFDTTSSGNLIENLTERTYLLENLNPGIYYDFYARAECSNNNYSRWSLVYSFSTWYVGVPGINRDADYIIYPIPANEQLNISSTNKNILYFNYSVVDINGVNKINGVIKNHKTQIDISKLMPGLYCIIIYNEKGVNYNMFIKQ